MYPFRRKIFYLNFSVAVNLTRKYKQKNEQISGKRILTSPWANNVSNDKCILRTTLAENGLCRDVRDYSYAVGLISSWRVEGKQFVEQKHLIVYGKQSALSSTKNIHEVPPMIRSYMR